MHQSRDDRHQRQLGLGQQHGQENADVDKLVSLAIALACIRSPALRSIGAARPVATPSA